MMANYITSSRFLSWSFCLVVYLFKLFKSMTTRSPFPPSSSSSSSSSSSWSHRFFTFLRLLSFNPAQFTRLLEQYAQWFDGTNQPYSIQWHSQFLRHHGKPVKNFTVRPTVILQAVVPSTGFAVTFRAMLDSGAYASFISRDLAAMLLEEGGATEEYIWPAFIDSSFYPKHTLLYRRLCNLQLKSVDEEAEEVVEQFTLPFVNVKDSITYWVERLPVGLLISKMASLGFPVVSQRSQKRRLERSMLWPKERKANSQYRVDMLIGQDLLNAHFNVHPRQPTYHISPSLVLFRTKMGLAFMEQFDTEKFKHWTISKKKTKEMKIALYSLNKDKATNQLSTAKKDKISCILKPHLSWKDYAVFFLTFPSELVIFVCPFVLISVLSLVLCLAAAVLKFFLNVTFIGLPAIPTVVQSLYTDHLLFWLLRLTVIARELLEDFSRMMGGCFGSHQLPVRHHFLVSNSVPPIISFSLKVPTSTTTTTTSAPITKTVNAFIDTGACNSFISTSLVKELNLTEKSTTKNHSVTSDDHQTNLVDVDVEVGGRLDLNPKQHAVSIPFSRITFKQTSIEFTSKSDYFLNSLQLLKISRMLNLPVAAPVENCPNGELLIGADLIPSLLMMMKMNTPDSNELLPSLSHPRVIALAANLHAVETRLGYYLQGTY